MIESSDNNPTNELGGKQDTTTIAAAPPSSLKKSIENGDNQLVVGKDEDDGEDDDSKNSQKWVKFDTVDNARNGRRSETEALDNIRLDDDDSYAEVKTSVTNRKSEPAVLDTESIHVTIERSLSPERPIVNGGGRGTSPARPPRTTGVLQQNKTSGPAVIDLPSVGMNNHEMRTVDLSTAKFREGFSNGDTVVSLMPVNGKLPWITPARFRPELVPEELMAQGLTVRTRFVMLRK